MALLDCGIISETKRTMQGEKRTKNFRDFKKQCMKCAVSVSGDQIQHAWKRAYEADIELSDEFEWEEYLSEVEDPSDEDSSSEEMSE